jgi:hypothetical protein
MSGSSRGVRGGTGTVRALFAVAVVVILLGSAFVVFGIPGAAAPAALARSGVGSSTVAGTTAPSTVSSHVPAAGPAGSGLALGVRTSGAPVASGRGTFFTNVNLSRPGSANLSCFAPYSYTPTVTCPNTTFDPSVNVTSSGVVGVAFTAFTNVSHCASIYNATNHTLVDVAFQASTTGGTTWSPIVYLGNQNCSEALSLADAWQPSLTSLSNGTFVLTYIEFNVSTCPSSFFFFCDNPVPPQLFPYEMPNSALVVQESYNGGSSWTTPQILNQTFNATAEFDLCGTDSGSPLYHPWISASGSSVYLAYENISDANGCSFSTPYSAGVHLVESTNGGTTWGAPVNFPTVGDGGLPLGGDTTNFSVNPYVLAASNGQVYVAYATGLEAPTSFCQPSGCLTSGAETQDVVVANATGGTGNWTVRYAATQEPFDQYAGSASYGNSPFFGLHPQLAYDPAHGQLDLVYNSESIGTFCLPNFGAPPTCVTRITDDVAVFQNSSNGGANWSQPEQVGTLVDPYGGPANAEFYPAIAVGANGTVDVTAELYNDTICSVVSGYYTCGEFDQVDFNTTNDGTTWNGPFLLSTYNWLPPNYAYTGEYETAATAPSGVVYYAWTDSTCGGPTAPVCSFASPGATEPNTTVVVSSQFRGPGLTLTFHEASLPPGTNWSAEVMGNSREAPAGTNLVVSGVPPGETVNWTVSWENVSYGVAWQPVASVANPIPPSPFAANTTLDFTYRESVLVTVGVNPAALGVDMAPGAAQATYSMSPIPGTAWAGVNTSFSLVVAPQAISCASFCSYENLTWVSWTGTGAGSVSSNATTVTLNLSTSPVNETANFLDTGNCQGSLGTLTCTGPYGYPLSFVESGLPAGTAWGVTLVANGSGNGTTISTSTTPWLNVTTGQNAAQYTLWTVPDGTSGSYWVPTSTPASPVEEPTQTGVSVTYTLEVPTAASFVANFTSTGLPNGTAWSAEIGSGLYAVTTGNLSLALAGGTPFVLNGSDVYTEDGVAFYVGSISVLPYVENTTWENSTNLSTSYWFNGSARIVVNYLPMYWLAVSASTGGSVTPASRWVESGATVTINATAASDFHFLDWTGIGAGSSTALQAHNASATIAPTAPVTEFATFRQDPPPTWNVTVTAVGLPASGAVTFTLGNSSFTGAGTSTTVGELLNGSYAFDPTTVYANASNGTRWVPTSWSSPFGPSNGDVLAIFGNGTVTVNYTTQFVLTVESGPGGTVTPATDIGPSWQDSGAVVALTAAPSYHYSFAGWNASGPSAVSGTTPGISVSVAGPTSEVATFVYRVFPPAAVFTLLVEETGLPSGIAWSVAVGSGTSSAAGPHSELNLTGLNGTYSLLVPAVYVGAGARYVANGSTQISVTVAANRSTTVAFSEQFAFAVLGSAGGNVSGAGTTWVGPGTSEALLATPSDGFAFVGWNGSGSGGATPYTGPNSGEKVVVNGPTNETATFAPVLPPRTTGSSTAGELPAFGLLVLLLVVGVVVGLLLGRRGGRSPTESDDDGAAGDSSVAGAGATDGSDGAASAEPDGSGGGPSGSEGTTP